MKRFNDDFKSKLYETIEDIENHSLVEIVSIFRANSGKYKDVSLWTAVAIMFLGSVFFMFSPIEFDIYMIWLFTFVTFIFGFLLAEIIKPLKRLFVSNKRMRRNSDIYGRAVFQKGGIRFTNERIGVLIYVSIFERIVKIIPDRGAFTAIPEEIWIHLEHNFKTIFSESDIANAFIKELNRTKETFSKYIPPIENDINELPDDLEIEL